MKTIINRILCTFTAGAMLASFTACGEEKTDNTVQPADKSIVADIAPSVSEPIVPDTDFDDIIDETIPTAPEEDSSDKDVVWDQGDIFLALQTSDESFIVAQIYYENNTDEIHTLALTEKYSNDYTYGPTVDYTQAIHYLAPHTDGIIPVRLNEELDSHLLRGELDLSRFTIDMLLDGNTIADDASLLLNNDDINTTGTILNKHGRPIGELTGYGTQQYVYTFNDHHAHTYTENDLALLDPTVASEQYETTVRKQFYNYDIAKVFPESAMNAYDDLTAIQTTDGTVYVCHDGDITDIYALPDDITGTPVFIGATHCYSLADNGFVYYNSFDADGTRGDDSLINALITIECIDGTTVDRFNSFEVRQSANSDYYFPFNCTARSGNTVYFAVFNDPQTDSTTLFAGSADNIITEPLVKDNTHHYSALYQLTDDTSSLCVIYTDPAITSLTKDETETIVTTLPDGYTTDDIEQCFYPNLRVIFKDGTIYDANVSATYGVTWEQNTTLTELHQYGNIIAFSADKLYMDDGYAYQY